MKIGAFPEGLLSFDLGELVKLRFLSDDWKATLASLFPKSTEQAPRIKEEDSIENTQPAEKEIRSVSKGLNTLQIMDSLQINTGDFLWIQISKIPSMEGVLLKPAQVVNEFLIREFHNEIKEIELMRLQYLTLLSQSLLAKIRSLSIYHESLLENSAVCKHGLWAIAEDNIFYKNFIKDNASRMSYLYNSNIKTAKDIQNIYNIHESNLSSSLRLSLIQPMITNAGILTIILDYD